MSPRTTGDALRIRFTRVGVAVAALALGASALPGLTPAADAAVVAPGDLQINEIYGGGGNSGSTFTHDFVELVNTSDQPIDLAGWSLQYASATGTFTAPGVLALEGTVPAGGTFLIQLAKGAGGTEALPEPDLIGTTAVSGSQGVFALSDSDGHLVCTGATCAEDPAVVDLVGWGGATTFSGTAPAPRTTNATSVARVAATAPFVGDLLLLDDYLGADYLEQFTEGVQVGMTDADGRIHAIASDLTQNGPFVNTDLFEQAGVVLPESWTWEEMADLAAQVQEATGTEFAFAMDKSGHRLSTILSQGGTYLVQDGSSSQIGRAHV